MITYWIEEVYSVRINESDWTKRYPDITFVDVDLEYLGEECELVRETMTMDIADWWIIEEYGYFVE